MAIKIQPAISSLAIFASVAVCACAFAQFRQPYKRSEALAQAQAGVPASNQANAQPVSQSMTAPANSGTAGATASSGTAPSLLNQPAQPAKVTLTAGKLTIEANNSTLSAILDQISHSGGMKILGLQGGKADQRIFGTYGPGAPRTVLSDLLNGSGYNVMMLGTTPAGVPRELALTLRPTGGVPNPPPQAQNNMRDEYEEDQIRPTEYAPTPENEPERPPRPAGMGNGVRTPQQILQELEQMRQRQAQGEQPN